MRKCKTYSILLKKITRIESMKSSSFETVEPTNQQTQHKKPSSRRDVVSINEEPNC